MQNDQVMYLDPAIDVIDTLTEYVRVVTPTGGFTIKDGNEVVRKVMRELQAGHTLAQLVEQFDTDMEKQAARQAVALLERRRLLSARKPAPYQDRLMDWMRHSTGAPQRALPRVELLGEGELAGALRRRLGELGFSMAEPGLPGETVVVAAADFADMESLRAHNALAIRAGFPFLPVWLTRSAICVGPLVEPGASGCLECLHHRERAALRMSDQTLDLQIEGVGNGASTVALTIAVELAVTELLRWVFSAYTETECGVGWRFNLMNFSMSGQLVLRLPRCQVCGGDHAGTH